MIVSGVGASTYAAKLEDIAFSRLTEVTITTVPARTPTGAAQSAGRMPESPEGNGWSCGAWLPSGFELARRLSPLSPHRYGAYGHSRCSLTLRANWRRPKSPVRRYRFGVASGKGAYGASWLKARRPL
jgi:hypothetical protein